MDIEVMKKYVEENLAKKNDYSFMEADYAKIVAFLVETENAYIDSLVPDKNGDLDYDDDAAFELLCKGLSEKFPQYKMYIETMVDDYLDVSEAFLTEQGDIEWI